MSCSAVGGFTSSAGAAVQEASDQLVALEREAASGGKVTLAKRREAEDELLRAKTAALAPWAERRAAARLAVEDARHDVARFVGANLDALLADLGAEGRAAAARLDAAAQAVLDAYGERADVEQRTHALIALVGRVRPGDVAPARSDQLATEAHRLLDGGGERPPDVLHRPDQPRHTAVAAVPA